MFQFKFESVLNYRRQIEDTCQQDFAISKNQWETETRKLEDYYELWKKCLFEWRGIQGDSVSIREIDLYQKYMLRLKSEITKQAERVKDCLQEMEEKREILLGAIKDKKMMEKLEEYHMTSYRRDQANREKKFVDDIATKRFNYKNIIK